MKRCFMVCFFFNELYNKSKFDKKEFKFALKILQ